MGATSYTPRTNYTNIIEPQTSSTTTKRASTSSYESTDVMTEDSPLKKKHKVAHATDLTRREQAALSDATTKSKPYVQVPNKTPRPKRTTAHTPPRTANRPASPTHTRSEPRQTTLIRRVQTVVEMPVKEEEDDDDAAELFSTSISASGSRGDAGGTGTSRKPSTRLRARRLSRRIVEDEDSDAASDVDDEYIARSQQDRRGDDDDDELRMGVEVR